MKGNGVKRSNEPIAWSLFGAGGMLLALIGPGLIVVTGFLMPLADDPEAVYTATALLLGHPLGKLAALACISLPLYHTVHRIYHGLQDLHLNLPTPAMQLLCYGGATLTSIACAGWLFVI